MKELVSRSILIVVDVIAIALSISLAYGLRALFDDAQTFGANDPLENYLSFPLVYIVVIAMLFYEDIYIKRYDFWHESRQTLKALVLSFLVIISILAMTKGIAQYSRAVFVIAFALMVFYIPLLKYITKNLLFGAGLWGREAKVFGNDPFIEREIFANHYLGYVKARRKDAKTIFINANSLNSEQLNEMIDHEIKNRYEVIFIPLLDTFDLTHSHTYALSNTRTNLVVLKNRLKSRYRLFLKRSSDIVLTLLIFPLLIPLLGYIAYKIRKEESEGSILFKQDRMGQNGQTFACYKFRTMYEDGDVILEQYLEEHPEEVQNYETYHKYENDPRITKIGHLLRKTSLDELPQIFNVMKNEMSFIGPRPYMVNEKEKIGKDLDTILIVRPGITGLWQVSGRSEVDFMSRVKLDVWYIQNWNLWMDFVILIKTVRTVLFRDGAS